MLHSRMVWLAASLIVLSPDLAGADSLAPPAQRFVQNETAPPAAPPPEAAPAPATPAPASPTDAPPPSAQSPQGSDVFGEEVTLPEKTIIYMSGNATWDSAFETLIDAFKQLNTVMDRQGLKANGPSMTIYTSTDDTGFAFQAAIPLAAAPANPPHGDIAVGKSPGGRALKFVHRGSYDSMDSTYEAITNFLDEKRLEARDLFVEEYATDPVTTPEDQLVITVYVPIK